MADRLKRLCDSCGGYDDGPRHIVASTPDTNVASPEFIQQVTAAASPDELPQLIADLMDTSSVMKHMECCDSDGCPDGSCTVVRAGAESLKGADLVAHLTSRNPEGA